MTPLQDSSRGPIETGVYTLLLLAPAHWTHSLLLRDNSVRNQRLKHDTLISPIRTSETVFYYKDYLSIPNIDIIF